MLGGKNSEFAQLPVSYSFAIKMFKFNIETGFQCSKPGLGYSLKEQVHPGPDTFSSMKLTLPSRGLPVSHKLSSH